MIEKMKHGINNESQQPFKGISGTYLLREFLDKCLIVCTIYNEKLKIGRIR